ncbi:MAG: metal-dependent transcriptional regulator [Cyclobacteriaceae bacterium]
MISPIASILIFAAFCAVLYLAFKPNGFYWVFQQGKKFGEKTIMEDVLKQLFHMEYENSQVKFRDLKVSSESGGQDILSIIDKMIQIGLISQKEDYLILEPKGREYALRIVRAHRLWEKYLAEKTGYDKSEWHDRAELMEHELSVDQTNSLATSLGSPRFDPHGDPIPTAKGDIRPQNGISLTLFPMNTVGKIIHIEDEPEVVYKQILAENIHIGSQIRVIESNKERLRFISEGEEYILAPLVAENISIEQVSLEDEQDKNVRRLSSVQDGEEVEIIGISRECRGANRRRLLDLGFVPGTKVSLGITSPLNDPRAYKVRNTDIALRNDQANFILIKSVNIHEQVGS